MVEILNRLIQIYGLRIVIDDIGPSSIDFTVTGWASFSSNELKEVREITAGCMEITGGSERIEALLQHKIRDKHGRHWPREKVDELKAAGLL